LASNTSYEAPHYAVFSSLLSLHLSLVQIVLKNLFKIIVQTEISICNYLDDPEVANGQKYVGRYDHGLVALDDAFEFNLFSFLI
jgi:hypothetical protein